jgi:3-polyprenyl-4-hydroxybenzoate decarboxylase
VDEDMFFLVDVAFPVRKYRRWRHLFPRVKPHYGEASHGRARMMMMMVMMRMMMMVVVVVVVVRNDAHACMAEWVGCCLCVRNPG